MANKKVTKAQVLEAIKAVVADDAKVEVGDVVVTADDIAAYVDTTLDQLASKAAKAKEKAAEKKAEGDALRDAVQAVLTAEPQTIAAIAEQVEGDFEVTNAKVSARLTQLVKAGIAAKEQAKVGDRKLNTYFLA